MQLDNDCARESTHAAVPPRAQPEWLLPGAGLLARTEEKIIRRVRYELSLTHRAGAGRNRSAVGVQALDEGSFEQ